MAGAHARVAPSSLARVVQCPGSLQLAEQFADLPESESAAEGTAAHWVVTQFVDGNVIGAGTIAPNGVVVDDEMIDGAWLFQESMDGPGMTETALRIPRIHPTECWGTPDYLRIVEGRPAILKLSDYKYGRLLIEVWENWQLIAYALGALDTFGLRDTEVICELTIVQPRCFHRDGPVRTWKVPATDLRALANRAEHAVAEALSDHATTRVGRECLFCPARHACKTLQATAFTIMDFDGLPERVDMDVDSMALELRMIHDARDRLKARATGLEAQIEGLLRAGRPVPFFKMENGRPSTKWIAPPDTIAMLGDMCGVNLRKPVAVLTPRQARLAGLADTASAAYSQQVPGAVKVMPDNTIKARKIFGHNAK